METLSAVEVGLENAWMMSLPATFYLWKSDMKFKSIIHFFAIKLWVKHTSQRPPPLAKSLSLLHLSNPRPLASLPRCWCKLWGFPLNCWQTGRKRKKSFWAAQAGIRRQPCQHSGIYWDALRSAEARRGGRCSQKIHRKDLKKKNACELMIMTGWIESVAKKARVRQPCDTHARRDVQRLKMSGAHARTSCNENSWRGCRRVHRGDEAGSEGGREGGREAGREGGMSSASHLDCQTLGARLGIFQREADTTCLHRALHFSSPTACSRPVCPCAPPACIRYCTLSVATSEWGGGHYCECASAYLRECLCAWNKLGVDHSAQRREGNESAESSGKNKDKPFF